MKTRHGACGRTWTQRGERTSHCAGCHETFAGLTLFDRHRVGPWSDRRCLDPAEMIDCGQPLAQDDEGVWHSPGSREAARRAFGTSADEGQGATDRRRGSRSTPSQPAPAPIPTPADSEPSQRHHVKPEETPR